MRSPSSGLVRILVALVMFTVTAAPPVEGKKKKKKGQPQDVPIVCYDVTIRGQTVMLAQTAGLSLWDVSDPLHPKSTFRLQLPATVRGVSQRAPYVYLAAGSHGLYIASWDGETEPVVVSRHDTPGTVGQVVLTGDYALLADDRYGVRTIDVSDPTRPLQKAQITTRGRVHAIALEDHVLAIAEGTLGVRLFDVKRPERPIEISLLREVSDARDVAWADGKLLVASGRDGLLVYGFGRDGKPERTGQTSVDGAASFVGGDGGLAVVSNGTPALQLIRVEESGVASLLNALRVHRSAPAGRIRVEGGMAYAALDRAGISIVDLRDPLVPEVLLPRERQLRIEWPDNRVEEEP